MTATRPDQILAEFARLRVANPDPALESVRMALLIEDVFRFTLADDQINPGVLGGGETLRNLIDASIPSR